METPEIVLGDVSDEATRDEADTVPTALSAPTLAVPLALSDVTLEMAPA